MHLLCVGLRDIALKEQYRSDRDDLVSEFFIPCLYYCIEYDRAIEYVAVKSLTNFYFGLRKFIENEPKIRMVTGHRFRTYDLNFLVRVFQNGKSSLKIDGVDEKKVQVLQNMITNDKLKLKIAIPNSDLVYGSFSENIGVFRDENDDVVAFTGTSNETFDPEKKNFESIDVFTSWNDKSRTETKVMDFENLWKNKTKTVEVYDFVHAAKNNLLKYSAEWLQK